MSNTGLALNLIVTVFFTLLLAYALHIMAQRRKMNLKYLRPEYDKLASKHPYRIFAVFIVLCGSQLLSGLLHKSHPALYAAVTILTAPCLLIAYLLVRKYWE